MILWRDFCRFWFSHGLLHVRRILASFTTPLSMVRCVAVPIFFGKPAVRFGVFVFSKANYTVRCESVKSHRTAPHRAKPWLFRLFYELFRVYRETYVRAVFHNVLFALWCCLDGVWRSLGGQIVPYQACLLRRPSLLLECSVGWLKIEEE